MDKVELRKKRIINIIYLAMVLGLLYLFIKYCFGLFFPFMFAFFIAIIVQKPSNYIIKKTKLGKGLTSAILVLLLYAALIFLVSLIGVKVVDGVKDLISFVQQKISDFPTLIEDVKASVLNVAKRLPDSVEHKFTASASSWFDNIRDKSASEVAGLIVGSASSGKGFSLSSLSTPLSGVWSTAKQIPSVFVAVIICIVSSCFMASDYDKVVKFIKRQMKKDNAVKLSKSKNVVFKSIGKLLRSYLIIICITGTEIFIGLTVLSLAKIYTGGHTVAISIIVAIMDILPVIGTGTFMVPWAVYSFITGKIGLGIGLIIIYVIIYIVRQIIEPKIIGGSVGLPSFVTLMAMYIGSQLFGVIGIFLLPIIVIAVKLLNDEGVIHIWKSTPEEEQAVQAIADSKIQITDKNEIKEMFKKIKSKK